MSLPILLASTVLLVSTMAARSQAEAPTSGCGELPMAEPTVTLTAAPLGVTRPEFPLPESPPPPGRVDPEPPPLPHFATDIVKPLPPTQDPGASSCGATVFRRAEGLMDCGVHRALQGDFAGARQSLQLGMAADPQSARTRTAALWLGEISLREGRWQEAEQSYQAALVHEPRDDVSSQAALGLAWLRLRHTEWTAAIQAVAEVSRTVPDSPMAHTATFLEGVGLLGVGRPADALAALDRVVASRLPQELQDELPFWRSVALRRAGDLERALETLDRLLAGRASAGARRADALLQAGWIALERGAAADAVRRFDLADRPGFRGEIRSQARAGLVRAHLVLGDRSRADAMARRLAAEFPGEALAVPTLLLVADAAVRSGAAADGLALYQDVLQRSMSPSMRDYAWYRLGEASELAGRSDDARRAYARLVRDGQDEAIAQRAAYRLGLVELRAGDVAAARREGESLLRAGALPELREMGLLLAAEGAGRDGDASRAVTLFRAILGEFPDSPRAERVRLALGWARLDGGDVEGALEEWRHARQAGDPDTKTLATLALAEVALREGRDAEALNALRDDLPVPPPLRDTIALDRGILAVRVGEWQQAVLSLEPVTPRLADDSRQALARRALGIAHYRLGQHDRAEREFRESLRRAPAEPSGWLGLGLSALVQGRVVDAEEAFIRARGSSDPGTAVSAAYGLVLVAVQRRDQVAFRERAAAFVDGNAAHAATPALLCALVAGAIAGGELEPAAELVTRLARDHPKSQYLRGALAQLGAAAQEQPALCRRAYVEVLARPVSSEVRLDAWFGLTRAALTLGKAADAQRAAEAFLREAPSADPRIPSTFARLVRIHEVQGRDGLALRSAETFLTRFPSDPHVPRVELMRGRLLVAERQWEAARRSLEIARDRGEPAVAAEAHFWLGETLRVRGDLEAAIASYLGATTRYPETIWAGRGLQGAAQSYLAGDMSTEAAILLRQLAAQPAAEPALVEWAREMLRRLGAGPDRSPRGTPGPKP